MFERQAHILSYSLEGYYKLEPFIVPILKYRLYIFKKILLLDLQNVIVNDRYFAQLQTEKALVIDYEF